MSEGKLATELLIKAYIRTAANEGVPITVIKRGDPSSGTLILKINLMNGTARILVEARFEGECVWTPVAGQDLMSDAEADSYLARQRDVDPDAWLIEIEDKQGRIWFPGKLYKS